MNRLTAAYAYLITMVALTARHAPSPLAPRLQGFVESMIAAARHLPPMTRDMARPGVPFISEVKCQACETVWPVYAPEGADLPGDPAVKALVECRDEDCLGLAEFA